MMLDTIIHGEMQLFHLCIHQINSMTHLPCANNYVTYRGSDVIGEMLPCSSMEARAQIQIT